jgi:hypothetical protein
MNPNELSAKLKEIRSRRALTERSKGKRRILSASEIVDQMVMAVDRATRKGSLSKVY